ncbi:uncharacterized protein LOC123666670 [Melitaea cinxia]|nr:uncharacterized protein LOC123666670 [Melitaea cinxia]
MKKRIKRDNKIDVDNFTADVIRSTVQNFHVVHKVIPTLANLRRVLNEKIGFEGCLETLRRLLLKLGYKWRKTENNRKVLTERHDIQMWRLKYLKKISEYRSQGRPIVYTDESYVLSTHVRNNTWAQKKESTPFLKKLSTGSRFILVHAGTENGFIENASLVYKANSTVGDYHSNMSYDNYIKWLNEKLLPNLPERSVIVLDNASYHNTQAEKMPTSTTNKADMQQWLRDKGIAYEQSLLKLELYDIIKKHKDQHIKYKIDDFIKSKGFDVLRLPPYHPELNAIENIWGIVKNDIASKNIEQNMTNMETLINESLNKVTSETWCKTCTHVKKIEKEYLKYFDLDFEFVIDLQNDSDDSEPEFENYVSDSD